MRMITDTIVAIITALQESAINVLRISGVDAIDIVNQIFSRDLEHVDSHTVHYGHIIDPVNKQVVDEVLVSVFRAPRTYTREDVVEISCHGGVLVTKKVLSLCLSVGARMAEPGEYTQRAFLNGRIDLSQAESVMELIQAPNEFAQELAISGVQGNVRKLIEPFLERLIQMIANIEVNIDYPEYDDVEVLTEAVILPEAKRFLEDLGKILKESQSGRIMKEGVKTVILGKPNVGKSSILNVLLEEDKAIVTEIAGTTRDLVEGWIRLENVALHLIDTAGLRDTGDRIEQIGIEKSRKALESAELVIVVFDASQARDQEDIDLLEATKHKERIIVYNKKDLVNREPDGLYVSALEGDVHELVDEINKRYVEHTKALTKPTLSNERHIAQVQKSYLAMQRALEALEFGMELDLVTIDLNESYVELASIIKPKKDINVLDEIFARFCLGK
ncbi:tRNA uridine-5-carboxymethylaminomethyl(34) synthesis GTPase MnmE [Erysipelothrix rhusiopathiae]|uniref:tRNA modification GTPase MnmE n=1 Tax=Erysipelothrix rhusiopathiae ATCC 19414 TaxID=525280 RepID=E7FWI7_ERYRH|nr:tRNA uridine-5-carboxymethylaminomethyl(34) synthesis GTPase MnmE [Erysipelothrix rhusiopathiae]AMS10308.1 tRNA modification GTPase [Erysipelothrix rhusiopathiae]AWU42328.1 tRNA uridine-5-carboxymethylaminomethyl(34) synthesis GTPase MnmE [Erysipelothrix rhusiopathiae]EFY08598.1 tRNA modification GTPase TrmE [Erysipelothrix rhusiopathiae ATCC 19414]MDE8040739.1 tRNA uridine-5-carboxymethylaminomethyl(34) synthesis GTPase MnmE [Erysipelothrix rhusiopathiae]MDE8042428.1 tRNA uridine-5-carboxy